MKQLRVALKQNGGSCVGCTEKHEYVAALVDVLKEEHQDDTKQSPSSKDEL